MLKVLFLKTENHTHTQNQLLPQVLSQAVYSGKCLSKYVMINTNLGWKPLSTENCPRNPKKRVTFNDNAFAMSSLYENETPGDFHVNNKALTSPSAPGCAFLGFILADFLPPSCEYNKLPEGEATQGSCSQSSQKVRRWRSFTKLPVATSQTCSWNNGADVSSPS